MILTALKYFIAFDLWFSFSARSPYQENIEKLDFEYRAGFKTEKTFSEWMYERENGKYYSGRENWMIKDFKDVNFKTVKIGVIESGVKDFQRSAKAIDEQEIYILFKSNWKYITAGAGYSYVWQNQIPAQCLKVRLEFNKVVRAKLEHTTDFYDRRITDIYLGKEIALLNHFVELETYVKYRADPKSYGDWFQAKIIFRFCVNRLWGLLKRSTNKSLDLLDKDIGEMDEELDEVDEELNELEKEIDNSIDSLDKNLDEELDELDKILDDLDL